MNGGGDIRIRIRMMNVDIAGQRQTCALCGAQVVTKHTGHPGYQAPDAYDIAHCERCDTSVSQPLETRGELYDLIYADPGRIPSYRRYLEYSKEVLTAASPLDYLAGREDVYWAVQNHLRSMRAGVRILEVGSGLGYLTFAVAKAGYDITGVDISQHAVDNATKAYGPHFFCADVRSLAADGKRYDLIILTEVIEHIPDALGLVRALGELLKPGGEILLTTPNKSFHPSETLWETDPPPIHLWWFSETSVRFMAQKLGMAVRFTDFSEFNAKFPEAPARASQAPTRAAVLAQDGSLVSGPGAYHSFRTALKTTGLLPLTRVLRHYVGRTRWKLTPPSADSKKRRGVLAAVLRVPPQ